MTKFLVQALSTGGTLCAFDTSALPKGFNRHVKKQSDETFERLRGQNRFWIGERGSVGEQICHIYVDEPLNLYEVSTSPLVSQSEFEALACPSGALWICGSEYAAVNPKRGSTRTPKGGLGSRASNQCVMLPLGIHTIRVTHFDNRSVKQKQAIKRRALGAALWICGVLVPVFGVFVFVLTFAGLGQLIQNFFGGMRTAIQNACDCRCGCGPGASLPEIIGMAVSGAALMAASIGGFLKLSPEFEWLSPNRIPELEDPDRLPDYVFEIRTQRVGAELVFLSNARSKVNQDLAEKNGLTVAAVSSS